MRAQQKLNEMSAKLKWNNHQNLNNLFSDIGWHVSKYVDGLQQIVPAANQLGTICGDSSLTQLVPVSPVLLEIPSAALKPHQAHKKARIGPESLFVALSHIFAALTHVFSSCDQPSERQEIFQLSTRIARCSANTRGCSSMSRARSGLIDRDCFVGVLEYRLGRSSDRGERVRHAVGGGDRLGHGVRRIGWFYFARRKTINYLNIFFLPIGAWIGHSGAYNQFPESSWSQYQYSLDGF